MLRIIHCITDEKFVNDIITSFEFMSDRCVSRYVHITNYNHSNYRFLSKYFQVEYLNSLQLKNEFSSHSCDVVFLHNIQSLPYECISQIPTNIKVVWLAWGFDIYGHMGSRPFIHIPNMLHSETKRLLWTNWNKQLIESTKIVLKFFRNKKIKHAVERVDYFSGIIPEEYDMMCDVSYFHAKQIDFRYLSPLSNITLSLLEKEQPVRGKNILIGNSGDPSNNHADIFKKLSKLDLFDRRIYVPLSYGENHKYIEKIKKIGKKIWGDNFVALEDYMPYEEYRKIISSCGFRFFGHERQQALGNINMALMDGCKLFLSDSSVLWNHLSKMGIKLYSIQKDVDQKSLFDLMDLDQANNNRKKIIEDLLTATQINRLYNMIDFLSNEIKENNI